MNMKRIPVKSIDLTSEAGYSVLRVGVIETAATLPPDTGQSFDVQC